MGMGIGVPNDKDVEALRESQFWRFIFGLPIIIYAISFLGIHLYVKYEPTKFLIFNDRHQEALLMIK
jgi:hypothetical protein